MNRGPGKCDRVLVMKLWTTARLGFHIVVVPVCKQGREPIEQCVHVWLVLPRVMYTLVAVL